MRGSAPPPPRETDRTNRRRIWIPGGAAENEVDAWRSRPRGPTTGLRRDPPVAGTVGPELARGKGAAGAAKPTPASAAAAAAATPRCTLLRRCLPASIIDLKSCDAKPTSRAEGTCDSSPKPSGADSADAFFAASGAAAAALRRAARSARSPSSSRTAPQPQPSGMSMPRSSSSSDSSSPTFFRRRCQ